MANCLLCGRYLTDKFSFGWLFSWQKIMTTYVCPRCLAQFESLQITSCCPGCGRKQKTNDLCKDCQRWQKMGLELLNNKALYVYNQNMMKDYIERYKFMGDYRWRLVFQEQFSRFVLQNYPKDYIYCPIPVDKQTYQTRGFNQVIGLCKGFKLTELVAFKEIKERKKQSHKTRKQRMLTEQPFIYIGPIDLKQQNVVLLDDIYTTGRTLYHAVNLLRQHNAGMIKSITLAR